jgi:hypothetical protein
MLARECGSLLRLRTVARRQAFVGLTDAELVLHFDEGVTLHYDWEGRLLRMCEPQRCRKRSLSHHVMVSHTEPTGGGYGFARLAPSSVVADALVSEAHEKTAAIHNELAHRWADIERAKPSAQAAWEQIKPVLEKAARFDVKAARRDAQRLHTVYGEINVLPPEHEHALVLHATEGCEHSECLFCDMYRRPYRLKTAAEFRQHVHDVVAFHGGALRSRHWIFLGQSNAVAMPMPALRKCFEVLRAVFKLPAARPGRQRASRRPPPSDPLRFEGVSSYLDANTGARRTVAEYRELRRLGLRRVYIGMETGDEALLRWLRKPATTASLRQTVRRLKAARIHVGLTVLLGAGGRRFNEGHIHGTARLLNELPLDRGDTICFSPLEIHPSGPYAVQTMAEGVECLTDQQMREQEQAVQSLLRFRNRSSRPAFARYELETSIY